MDVLTLEAMEARRGAGEVKEHFERLLHVGHPSISDLSYALKTRVKEDFKIEEKVRKKRSGEKPEYKTKDIRDIVGIRIVTLYRLDALSIIPIFLKLVLDNSGGEENKFFLDNPIEEVIIYSVNPDGDAQNLAHRIKDVFSITPFKDKCFIETKKGNYSSGHIVLWARAKYARGYVEVPVEVQIRTALEDVWSEMDHQLKYKRESQGDIESQTAAMIENCLAHLNVMKTLNDGLAQYGDQVKIQLDELDDNIRRVSRIRMAEEPERRLTPHCDYSGIIRDKMRDVLGRSREALGDEGNSPYKGTKRISHLGEALERVELAISFINNSEVSEGLRSEIDYVLGMERALLLFEIARRLGPSAGNEKLVDAQGIYQTMRDNFGDRGVVTYRLARVTYELGDREQAKSLMRDLLDNFADFDLDENHWVHASAYRVLGFWLWNDVRRSDRQSPVKDDDRMVIREAAELSAKAGAITVTEQIQPNEFPAESSRIMAQSNFLFFVVEFLEAGGEWAELEAVGISTDGFATALSEVSQFDEAASPDYHKLNTLRRVYLFQDDQARAKHFAALAVANLEGAGYVDRGGQSEPEFVLRECAKTLSS